MTGPQLEYLQELGNNNNNKELGMKHLFLKD